MRKFLKGFIQKLLGARFALIVLFCFFLASFFVFSNISFAQSESNYGLYELDVDIGRQSGEGQLKSTIARIINIALGFLGIVAVILIMYSGFIWMTAEGNEEKVARAKMIMRNAAIGLVIILLSWSIAWFVINKLKGATSPPGSGESYTGPPGGLPSPGSFIVQSISTSHEGADPKKDVYLCSSVQSQFNHWLKSTVFESLKDGDTLTIKQLIDGNTSVNVSTLKIQMRNNVISFKNRNEDDSIVDWAPNSRYEVRLSKSIEDEAGNLLEECADCDSETGEYYSWIFETGSNTDDVKPQITRIFPSENSVNVPRSSVFFIEFSEPIDVLSVIGEGGKLNTINISLYKFDYANGGFEQNAVPEQAFDVSLGDNEILFSLNKNYESSFGNGYLEPYTKYKLTIKNIEDLCGNKMDSEVVVEFETGSDLPGIDFVIPSDGFQYACPSTEVFAKFRTSMFNVRKFSCGVNDKGDGGFVLSGALSRLGSEGVTPVVLRPYPNDNYEGFGNPNDFCKEYSFNLNSEDVTDDLFIDSQYQSSINFIEPGGDVANPENKFWSFKVASPDKCANEPYITRLSPNQDKWGRCMSIMGGNFLNFKGSSSVVARLDLNSDFNGNPIESSISQAWNGVGGVNMDILDWSQRLISADFIKESDVSSLPLPGSQSLGHNRLGFEVLVKVDHGSPIGVLESNAVDYILIDRTKEYNGPCLDSINPSSGFWGDSVSLSGRRLGNSSESNSVVFYNNKTVQQHTLWNENKITGAIVPEFASNNPNQSLPEVFVNVGGVCSNELNFDIVAGIGDSCSTIENACSPDQNLCANGLECRLDGEHPCTCQISDRFIIRNPYPSACSDSCTNATVGFESTKNIDSNSINSNSILLLKCSNESCLSGFSQVSISPSLVSANKVEFGGSLDANTWYRVVVLAGASGLKSSDNKSIYNTNFLYQDFYSYSWTFRTGSSACGVSRIDISPSGGILYENRNYNYRATAYSIPNSCSLHGQRISANFSWSDKQKTSDNIISDCQNNLDEPLLLMSYEQASSSDAKASVSAVGSGEKEALICVQSSQVYSAAPVILKAECKTNADCYIDGCQAICVEGVCMPKINSFSPANGKIGTWVTIDGCYFGNDWGEVKIGDTNAVSPDEALCGNTWSNTQIIAEARSGGFLKVIRKQDGKSDSLNRIFTIKNNVSHPTICRIRPTSSRQGAFIEIKGANFGQLEEFSHRDNPGADNTSYGVIFSKTFTNPSNGEEVGEIKVTDEVLEQNMCPTGGWSNAHICIKVHTQAPVGNIKVKVKSNNAESAGYNFRVIDSNLIPTGAKNLSLLSHVPKAGDLACPDTYVEVLLDGVLDLSSLIYHLGDNFDYHMQSVNFEGSISMEKALGIGNFYIIDEKEKTSLSGTVYVSDIGGKRTKLIFAPDQGEIYANGKYWIVLRGGPQGLRSSSGGILNVDNNMDLIGLDYYAIYFNSVDQAGDNRCRISHLEIEPSNPVFNCVYNGCPGDIDSNMVGYQRAFTASPVNFLGQTSLIVGEIVKWSSSDESIIPKPWDFRQTGDRGLPDARFTINPKNGSSIISAYLEGSGISGSTEARVFLCENPWPSSMLQDGIPFSDSLSSGHTTGSTKTNFSTFYCRDRGNPGIEDDLPAIELVQETTHSASSGSLVPGLLKELFFKQPRSKYCSGGADRGDVCENDSDCDSGKCSGSVDAIGIRVLSTKICVSGVEEKIGKACVFDSDCVVNAGQGGYCAINTSNYSIQTWYQNQNIENGAPSSISVDGFDALKDGRTIYVSAVNDTSGNGGSPSSVYKNIYLISMNDNTHQDTADIYNQLVENWRFLVNIINQENREKLHRDLQRIDHAYYVSNLIKYNPTPVKLDSGSFKKGLSVSTWPSWKEALSNDFGVSLPIDPINVVNCQESFKPTCWNGTDFLQPSSESWFYKYEYIPKSDGQSEKSVFEFNLEYGQNANCWGNILYGEGWDYTDSYFDVKFIKSY